MTYESATTDDLQSIVRLLTVCELPSNDVDAHLDHFIVAKETDSVVGCVGMELKGPLLRSLAVDPSQRNRGVAQHLCEELLQHANKQGVQEIFLLTTTSAKFFDKIGFQRKDRDDAPESVRKNRQFTELCPSSAVLMWKKL
ncbi:arsenic resistance N-acetyltransferase ArsN2 [bacterium]|nr:arsenic resistance N-acetyltransferase ArsN2 [bacterium]MCI0604563.1 arsenic resistance N-acetyltransferase ArsN2 [bacterium]